MRRTHSSETSLSCERSSNRIVSGLPFTSYSPWSAPRDGCVRLVPMSGSWDYGFDLEEPVAVGKRGGVRPRALDRGGRSSLTSMDFKYTGAL